MSWWTSVRDTVVPVAEIAGATYLGGPMAGLAVASANGTLGGGGKSSGSGTPKSPISAAEQQYFDRPSQQWDFNKLQGDASASGQGLSQFIAQNWNNIFRGQYNTPVTFGQGTGQAVGAPQPMAAPAAQQLPWQQVTPYLPAVAHHARGGLHSAAMVMGAGGGRDDAINAKLSDGEYVVDAETVSMLGNGSNKAGAQRLDQMREAIRQQKGPALAKGDISPDAKSPLAYLKGAR